MSNITYKTPVDGDCEAIDKILRITFAEQWDDNFDQIFQKSHVAGNTIAAYDNGNVVGVGTWNSCVIEEVVPLASFINTAAINIELLTDQLRSGILEGLPCGIHPKDLKIKTYQNKFVYQNITSSQEEMEAWNAAVFTSLAVLPDYQNQGIGGEILRLREQGVRNMGGSHVFGYNLEESFVSRIYERNGYSPIIQIKPFYADGKATTVFGKNLN